jgi:putative membrane protein
VVTSTIFLACYLTYHFTVRIMTKFPPLGWIQKFYYVMLTSHILLAFVTLPLVILTLIPALRARYDKHRRIARWTMPIWLYVSVTGVLVYMMLYQWFPPAAGSAVLLK